MRGIWELQKDTDGGGQRHCAYGTNIRDLVQVSQLFQQICKEKFSELTEQKLHRDKVVLEIFKFVNKEIYSRVSMFDQVALTNKIILIIRRC